MSAQNQGVVPLKPKSLFARMAERFGVDPGEMLATLKATAFKGNVTDAQMQALMIVADQYGLNPWTKEIYAFPDKGGIVPVVGVDGWARIINENPAFDGMEFAMDKDGTECTCKIYRKDRGHAISATEYMAECKRGTQPWQSHPRRMLRHKAMIQCARLAFGFAGIYDQDEAERIVTNDASAPSADAGPAIDTIRNAQSMEELQAAFTTAWKDLPTERAALTKAKDDRKKELSEPVDAQFEEVPDATGE